MAKKRRSSANASSRKILAAIRRLSKGTKRKRSRRTYNAAGGLGLSKDLTTIMMLKMLADKKKE